MTGHSRRGSAGTRALGLHTDLYELRMVDSYVRRGMDAPATFSLYVRGASERPWHVALGIGRVVELLEVFRYSDDELGYLREQGFGDEILTWLADFEPSGELWAVADGTVVLADEPICEFTASLPVAQLLETAIMNVVQFPTLIATKAAKVALAAEGRDVVDFGFRRAHGLETGIEAAWAARIGGGLATSNVEAGRRYGIPIVGTMAHAFVQSFEAEIDAFRAFAQDHPDDTVLLVDTYDTHDGVRNAIAVGREMRERGESLRGIRLDSGDLGALARDAREMLDEAGLGAVQIFASGGLDEQAIHELVTDSAPIDAFGVGTDLVVSRDRPALDIAYKLVEYAGEPRAKFSEGKVLRPGAKQVFRTDGPSTDVLGLRDESLAGEPLLSLAWKDGRAHHAFDDAAARERAMKQLALIPEGWARPPYPDAPPRPRVSDELEALTERVREEFT